MNDAELDQVVSQALADLQASGEPTNVESVARRIQRRTSDVLSAMKRLAGSNPAPPDLDLPPEQYPAVLEVARKLEAIQAARQDAEQTLEARERLLNRADAQATEALINGGALIDVSEVRTQVQQAAEVLRLLVLAEQTLKVRHGEALATAEAMRWSLQWARYQGAVRAFDMALAEAFAAQTEAMRWWNLIGQPGQPPLLRGPLSVYPSDFHPFLQEMILDLPAEQVRRGAIFSGGLPPRGY